MMKQSVNVYDFDHTIYDGDASLDFIIYCMLRNPRTWKYGFVQAIALVKYLLGLADRKQIKQAGFAFLRDLPDGETAVRKFWTSHEHKIKKWYIAQKTSDDLIVSASPEFLLKPIAEKLGILGPIATIMDIRSGSIRGQNCRGQEKLRRLRAYNSLLVIESCYSDSLADRPLLELATHPYIVKGNKLIPYRP